MMNKFLDRTRRSTIGTKDDAGVALVMTLGIMLVGIVIIGVVAAVAVSNATSTVRNRAELLSFQSADAGLDDAISILAPKAHDEIHDACGLEVAALSPMTVNGDQVVITQQYTVRSLANPTATTLGVGVCPDVTDTTVRVVLRATATTPAGIGSDGPVVRTAVAELIPVPPQVGLDKAIFSDGSVTLTSGTVVKRSEGSDADDPDAHVYANGDVNCASNMEQGGTVYAAQGDVTVGNGCEIANTVWASGSVAINNGGIVHGDIWAASYDLAAAGYGIILAGTNSSVSGSLLTNGDILLSGSKALAGNVYSHAGSVWLDQVDVVGSIYSEGTVDLKQSAVGTDVISRSGAIAGDGNNKTDVGRDAKAKLTITGLDQVGGATEPGATVGSWPAADLAEPAFDFGDKDPGYPEAIDPPEPEPLPQITMNDTDIDLWSAAGWTVESKSGVCDAASIDSLLRGGTVSVGEGRLILLDGCSGPVQMLDTNVDMSGNVALVSWSGFTTPNQSWLTSNLGGEDADLYLIVPADVVPWSGGSPSCPATELYDILFKQTKFDNVKTFAYTPCDFVMQPSSSSVGDGWEGQIYAGQFTLNAGTFEMQMAQMALPSAVSEPTDLSQPANLTVVARYDEH